LSKLITLLPYYRGKSSSKIGTLQNAIYQLEAQSKQLPNRRKFAQPGHPGADQISTETKINEADAETEKIGKGREGEEGKTDEPSSARQRRSPETEMGWHLKRGRHGWVWPGPVFEKAHTWVGVAARPARRGRGASRAWARVAPGIADLPNEGSAVVCTTLVFQGPRTRDSGWLVGWLVSNHFLKITSAHKKGEKI
jgi:hypothetical protein